ncbi:hypothetical protein [Staphylococcus phage vB_SauM-V1SA22]|nr:hypothetical protein [Staphylococcus phage vB_SauM-V1SA22]
MFFLNYIISNLQLIAIVLVNYFGKFYTNDYSVTLLLRLVLVLLCHSLVLTHLNYYIS